MITVFDSPNSAMQHTTTPLHHEDEHPNAHIEYRLTDHESPILISFLKKHPELIPKNVRVSVIQYGQEEKRITTKHSLEVQGEEEFHPDPESALHAFSQDLKNFSKINIIVNAIDLLNGKNKEKYLKIFRAQDASLAKDTQDQLYFPHNTVLQQNSIFSPNTVKPQQETKNRSTCSP